MKISNKIFLIAVVVVFLWGHPLTALMAIIMVGSSSTTVYVGPNVIQADPYFLTLVILGLGGLRVVLFLMQTVGLGFWKSMDLFVIGNFPAVITTFLVFFLYRPIEGNLFGLFYVPIFLIATCTIGLLIAILSRRAIKRALKDLREREIESSEVDDSSGSAAVSGG